MEFNVMYDMTDRVLRFETDDRVDQVPIPEGLRALVFMENGILTIAFMPDDD